MNYDKDEELLKAEAATAQAEQEQAGASDLKLSNEEHEALKEQKQEDGETSEMGTGALGMDAGGGIGIALGSLIETLDDQAKAKQKKQNEENLDDDGYSLKHRIGKKTMGLVPLDPKDDDKKKDKTDPQQRKPTQEELRNAFNARNKALLAAAQQKRADELRQEQAVILARKLEEQRRATLEQENKQKPHPSTQLLKNPAYIDPLKSLGMDMGQAPKPGSKSSSEDR